MLSGVIHKMIQDTQERLIFRASMYIKDVVSMFRYTYGDLLPYLRLAGTRSTALEKDQHFPTLTNTLQLLAILHQSVEKGVFEGLAQEAIGICTQLLVRCSEMIVGHKGKDRVEFAQLESHLFLIRHLLALREHITPYDISFVYMEKWVDFTNGM